MSDPGAPEAAERRREARERALSLLYEAEIKGLAVADVIAALPVPPDPFAVELAEGAATSQDTSDELITRFAKDWRLERMPSLDRAVLRIGTFELLERPDIPTAVVLNEAVTLAKRFSTDDSGRFVNGVLARIAKEVRD